MPSGPRPQTENVAEVKMQFEQDGQTLFNTHHFFDDAGWDAGRLNNLGTAIVTWYDDNIQPIVSNTLSLVAVTCQDLSVPDGVQTSTTSGLPIVGSLTQAPAPNSVTLAVKKATGLAGRAHRGRTYHCGIINDQVISNTITSGLQSALVAAYDSLRSPGSGLFDPNLVVLSEVVAGAWRASGVATIVTGISVNRTIDNQRRRLPERGR